MSNRLEKHTPGPWVVVSDSIYRDKDGPTHRRIATVAIYGDRDRKAQANARLIAAAPELQAALEGVMKWWQGTPQFAAGEDEMPAAVFDAARAALSKAKGGAQ